MDPRYALLAENLLGYSVKLKRGQRVMIDAQDVPDDIVIALIRAARARKALPYVRTSTVRVTREAILASTEESVAFSAEIELERMKGIDAYVALRGSHNIFELSDVPHKQMQTYMRVMRPVQNQRVQHTNWVVLRWPTPAMAQQAFSSTESFEDYFFRVCTFDHSKMTKGQRALKRLMDKTDQVVLKGDGTDLTFSIKGLEAVMCTGERNIPDGEVFTAPVRDSVNGVITYNAPTVYQGNSFDRVRFEFKDGKIVDASANGDPKKLQAILDSDEGARYIGEFAIGFNPHITTPIRDILFDEKIAGSFHFTPGQAYEGEADNGNRSQVHWDIVNIQRPDYGGGEIWFDGKLIRKDGLFLPKALQALNPEELLKEFGDAVPTPSAAPKKKAKKKAAKK